VRRIMVRRTVLNLAPVCAPHVERSMVEKEQCYICLGRILTAAWAEERVVVYDTLNGHVGAGNDGQDGVRGGNGTGSRNAGQMILQFADANDVAV